MPDTKISGLPAATTPLAGTEVLPIVQGGVTEQVSVDNLTAGKAVSASSLTLTGSPLAVSYGGTGQTSYVNGELLIGNSTGNTLTKATLTAGTGISISNGAGSITVTNSAPDQTVSLTGAGTTVISGVYPNFTITSNDQFVGTVTSVSGTGTVNGITLSGTVTASGNLTLGGTLSGVSLTTQVSGILPVANGGTGTSTAFTQGSIVFAGASGVYAQDNSQLFWNDTTDKMSIGTNATLRNARLSIKGLNETLTSGNGQLCLITSDAVGLDVGASLVLGGQSSPRADNPFATISGRSENNSYAGYFSINTGSVGGGMPERIRVNSSGFTQFVSNLVLPNQPTPTTKAAAATLTGAELITGILQYTGGAATVNFPAGANIEGALLWAANNVSLDFFVINTGAGTCTMGANGNTTVGALTVAAATSAHFRVRRTAANTFTIYRLV